MDQKLVSVVRGDGAAVVYGSGNTISLASFGGGELAVDEIFG